MTEIKAKAKDCIENHTHKLVDKPTKQDIYLREESIFISGYKLGAKENGFTWHDLRKNPNDVPEEEHTVILLTEVGATTAQYDKKFESFFRMNEKLNYCIFIAPLGYIAWAEIPLFTGE